MRLGRPTCSSAARPVGPRDRSCRGPAPASLRSSPASRPWGRSVRRVGDCRGQCRTRQVILGERVSDQHGHMVSRSPEGGRWITDDSARSGQIADQSRRYRSSGRCSYRGRSYRSRSDQNQTYRNCGSILREPGEPPPAGHYLRAARQLGRSAEGHAAQPCRPAWFLAAGARRY